MRHCQNWCIPLWRSTLLYVSSWSSEPAPCHALSNAWSQRPSLCMSSCKKCVLICSNQVLPCYSPATERHLHPPPTRRISMLDVPHWLRGWLWPLPSAPQWSVSLQLRPSSGASVKSLHKLAIPVMKYLSISYATRLLSPRHFFTCANLRPADSAARTTMPTPSSEKRQSAAIPFPHGQNTEAAWKSNVPFKYHPIGVKLQSKLTRNPKTMS